MKKVNKFANINVIIHICSVAILFSLTYILFFSPVIFSERLLAPQDGIIQSVPAFYSIRTLWTDLLLSGFPTAADPTVETWYPVSLLFSLIPNSWNSFVISAYILASCFSYGYVYKLTNSKLASAVSGIGYGMSGFMMAHLGHTSMIHTAAWLPLVIWSLEELRFKFSVQWFAGSCFAIACCIFAGHPQITVYILALSFAYVLVMGWTASLGKWNYYKLSLAALLLGIALATIQILPTAELSNLGLRTDMSLQEFTSYSLPLPETIQLIFPYFFGGKPSWLYNTPYFGTWGLTETTGYVGLLSFMLASVGLINYDKSKNISRFWGFTALVAFLLTLGNATPLAWLLYHIPVINKFRVPARHLIEMTFAVSVLSGLGVTAIQKQLFTNRLLIKIVLFSAGILTVLITVILQIKSQIYNRLQEIGSAEELKKIALISWTNPAVSIPIFIFLVSVIFLICWSKFPSFKGFQFFLLFVLILDLGSFGWFYEWQYASPAKSLLTPNSYVKKYAKELNSSKQRMLPIRGASVNWDEIPVNLSRLWGVPSASGYGPLILSRLSKLLSMNTSGAILQNSALEARRSLDNMSIRYVFTPEKTLSVSNFQGINWANDNLNTSLGNGCSIKNPNSIKFSLPPDESTSNAKVTSIGIVSSLGCSPTIPNDTEVLQVRLTDSSGKVATQNLRAGKDTSEWAYDCQDVVLLTQHSRARLFESFPVERDNVPKCQGHRYFSVLPLNQLNNVQTIELNWVGKIGAIDIQKISLINQESQKFYPVTTDSVFFTDTTHWRHIENINGASVYENLQAMPRTWVVPEAVSLKPDEVLRTINTSKLPNGRIYEPSKIALVEESIDFKAKNFDLEATSKFVKLNDTHIQIQTHSNSPAFLILSDVYYPGWKAKIDGSSTHIFETNYVLRGVMLPAGNHTVEFEFKPKFFYIGVGIGTATLAFLGYLSFKYINKSKLITSN